MDIINFQNSALPHFFQQVVLDNVPYKLYLDWNTRCECWSLRFNDIADVTLVAGIKLVLNYELISRYKDRGLPPGYLLAIDTSEKLERIGRDDMGSVVFLTYIEESEVESL